jgi:hypothetical protein
VCLPAAQNERMHGRAIHINSFVITSQHCRYRQADSQVVRKMTVWYIVFIKSRPSPTIYVLQKAGLVEAILHARKNSCPAQWI